MPLFRQTNGKLHKLKASAIDVEKTLQSTVEQNLFEVLEMHFLATEYSTTFGGRIDTLAVDVNGAPVIIEYKRNRNDNVINQGLSYLKWLQAQKVEFFEMLMIKKLGEQKGKDISVDWANPRVVCIAESYSKFDIDTVEVIPMRIELFKYRFYGDDIFSLEPMAVSEHKSKSGQPPTSDMNIIDVNVDDHLRKTSPEIRELFENLRTRIFQLDESVKEKATSEYIAYRISKNFTELHLLKKKIKIFIRPLDYDDPKKIVEKVPDSYNWTMDRRVYLDDVDQMDYIFGLIEQSYQDVL